MGGTDGIRACPGRIRDLRGGERSRGDFLLEKLS